MSIMEMRVHMDCAGCESKIKKALEKLEGVEEVEVKMGMQKVTVTGWAEQKDVLRRVRKTGRRAELWPFPHHNNNNQDHDQYQNNQYYYNYQQQQQQQEQQLVLSQHMFQKPQPVCSYNYYEHGYDFDYGCHHKEGGAHSTTFNEQEGALFSDDNPHACSIM